jgi:hypothetical protein
MTDVEQAKIRARLYTQASDIITGKTKVNAGCHFGTSIDALIQRVSESDRIMMSDREFEYILARCDALKEAITKNRLWGR